MKRKNNEQINDTDYYQLPCGKYLEDFIWVFDLTFAEGSALKYLWRAGKKDGESAEKDLAKCRHYCAFVAKRIGVTPDREFCTIVTLCQEAKSWDGKLD